MYAKLINNKLQIAGNKIKIENGCITNPTEEQLKELGYKTVEYTERPEYDKEEEKLVETYTETDVITVNYEKVALTDEEHNAIIKQEISEEENKITARNLRGALLNIEYDVNKIQEIEDNIASLRTKLR